MLLESGALAEAARSYEDARQSTDDPLLQERGLALVAELGEAAGEALAAAAATVQTAHREHLFRMVTALPPSAVSKPLLDQLGAGLEDPSEDG